MKVAARVTTYRISNGGLSSKDLPSRLKFLDWGDSPTVKGATPVRVNANSASSIPALQKARGWDRIALDFEHNTVKGTPEYERSQEPRAVAAYGSVVCVPGDGLYLDDIQWTPHGEKFAREYCDLSPAPAQTADGTVMGVHSVALCRHGAVDGLQFYSVEIDTMGGKAMDWRKWLLGFVGKGDETKDEDLLGAFQTKIGALCAEAVAPVATALDALKVKVEAFAAPTDPTPVITALSADVTALKGQVAVYSAEILKRDRADVLAQAAREGKVVALSAEAVAALSIEQLKDHVKGLPVTVPLERRTPEHVEAFSAEAIAAQSAVETVARACGIDPAKVK